MDTTESWPLERVVKSIVVEQMKKPILSHIIEKRDDKVVLEIYITYGCHRLLLFTSVGEKDWGGEVAWLYYDTCECPNKLSCKHFDDHAFNHASICSDNIMMIAIHSDIGGSRLMWHDGCVGDMSPGNKRWVYCHENIDKRDFFNIIHEFAVVVNSVYES